MTACHEQTAICFTFGRQGPDDLLEDDVAGFCRQSEGVAILPGHDDRFQIGATFEDVFSDFQSLWEYDGIQSRAPLEGGGPDLFNVWIKLD